ncbi:hypothetical protein OAA60_00620 [Porticoccaceae bacterium]|nr:hypothetical protein [Porticoccaceae bacterium]
MADRSIERWIKSALGYPIVEVEGLPVTAFGELQVEQKTPQVQLRFPYNVVPADIGQVLTNNASSSVSVASAVASVTCAGAYPAFSQIRTVDTLRYGPGQGAEFLGTCAFTTGVALSSQVFGVGDDDEGLYFGYNGTSFGILERSFGSLEVKSLTITAPESGGAGNITITLDSTAVTVAIAENDTIAEVVAAIVAASADFFNAGRGWEVYTEDNLTVKFISLVAENAGGTFSFADTDSTGVTASSFSEPVAGVAPTETWIAQASWNGDVMDGTGPSGMTLDPTKLNVFKISFQYLGAGAREYFIESQSTGHLVLVHTTQSTNQNTIPWVRDPTFHLNMIAKTESGYSGGALVMKTASMGGFIQGIESKKGVRRGVAVTKSLTTSEQPFLIISNSVVFNSIINKISVFPDVVIIANESGTKDLTVNIKKKPTSITGAAALTAIQAGVSVMSYGSTGTAVVGGSNLLSFVIAPSSQIVVNLADLQATIHPEERFVFTGIGGGSLIASISITWIERM